MNQLKMKFISINWRRVLPATLLLSGIGFITLGIGADFLGIGGGGFGAKQITLILAGAIALSTGIFLTTSTGWRLQHYWRTTINVDSKSASYLLIGAWFGLITGMTEALYWFVSKYHFGQFIHKDSDLFLTTLIFYLLLFLLTALFLTGLARLWPQVFSLKTAVFVFSFIMYYSLWALHSFGLHPTAQTLLSVGLAVQTARFAHKHATGFHKLIYLTLAWPKLLITLLANRKSIPEAENNSVNFAPERRDFIVGMGAVIGALALETRGRRKFFEVLTSTNLKNASTTMPNVLLIVLDTVRAQSLSLYGYQRSTSPELLKLAQSGVRFDRAIAPSSWTLPSHASMFTGYPAHKLSTGWSKPLDNAYPTLAEVMRDNGFQTAGFVANTYYAGKDSGLARGFIHYEDYRLSPGQLVMGTAFGSSTINRLNIYDKFATHENFGLKSARLMNESFLRWLSRRSEKQPYFAFLNFMDAHDPYLPPLEFSQKFAPGRLRGFITKELSATLEVDKIRELVDAYDSCIAYLDHHLGLLFSELEKSGDLENTLVIITSDHGEYLSEHGSIRHGNGLHSQVINVPLFISFPPRIPTGEIIHNPVSLRDLPTTILDLLGLNDYTAFPGSSLTRHWESRPSERSFIQEPILSTVNGVFYYETPIPQGPMQSIVVEGMHFIRYANGTEELFDFFNDPYEEQELAGTRNGKQLLPRFRSILEESMKVT